MLARFLRRCYCLITRPYWMKCDGGEPNRSFINMCIENPDKDRFVTYDIKTGGPLVIMVDCIDQFILKYPADAPDIYFICLLLPATPFCFKKLPLKRDV